MKSVRITYLVVLLLCFCYMVMIADYVSFLTMCAALLLPVLLAAQALLLHGKIKACYPQQSNFTIDAGQSLELHIKVENTGLVPLSMGQLLLLCENQLTGQADRVKVRFRLGSFGKAECVLHLQSNTCGRLNLRVKRFGCYDALGLFQVKGKFLNEPPEVLVLPEVYSLSCGFTKVESSDYESSTFSKHRPGDDPSEVFGIREYRPGDLQRSIHWKLSSKQEQLIVKEFSLPIRFGIVLLAELCRENPVQLCRELSALFSVSVFFTQAGQPHRILWYDSMLDDLCEAAITEPEQIPETMTMLLHAGGCADGRALSCFLGGAPVRGVDKFCYFTTSWSVDSKELMDQNPLNDTKIFLFGEGTQSEENMIVFGTRPVEQVLDGVTL